MLEIGYTLQGNSEQRGWGVGLVTVSSLARELGLPQHATHSFLAAVGVPTLIFGPVTYFNLSTLEHILHNLTRQGGPGYTAGTPMAPHADDAEGLRLLQDRNHALSKKALAQRLRDLIKSLRASPPQPYDLGRAVKRCRILDNAARETRRVTGD